MSAISTIISFGDSWTAVGYDIHRGIFPSVSNPLGVPQGWPRWGFTSANDGKWLYEVATSLNARDIPTFDFADGGATVDASFVAPFRPEVKSFVNQVNDNYLPALASRKDLWHPRSTLTTVWFGINDVTNSHTDPSRQYYGKIIERYFEQGMTPFEC